MSEPADLLDRALDADFADWYRERERTEQAREGRFDYIGPSDPPDADVHYPSSLLQCRRKRRYRDANAPAEDRAPKGYFWVGNRVETDLMLPFLEDRVAGPDQYVTKGLGFQSEVETPTGTVKLRGRTDPAVTTESGDPLLVTEVKTVGDFEYLDGPRDRHRAQVHAYLHALGERTQPPLDTALLVYVSKATLGVRAYPVSFDEAFWTEQVLPWLAAQTVDREEGRLPPADPVESWECDRCSFRRRCGESEYPTEDAGPVGFVPRFEYPRDAVLEHLEATDAPLTPTLAATYPDLADSHPVADWTCHVCGHTEPYGELEWSGTIGEWPTCPACRSKGIGVEMSGPEPESGWPAGEDQASSL